MSPRDIWEKNIHITVEFPRGWGNRWGTVESIVSLSVTRDSDVACLYERWTSSNETLLHPGGRWFLVPALFFSPSLMHRGKGSRSRRHTTASFDVYSSYRYGEFRYHASDWGPDLHPRRRRRNRNPRSSPAVVAFCWWPVVGSLSCISCVAPTGRSCRSRDRSPVRWCACSRDATSKMYGRTANTGWILPRTLRTLRNPRLPVRVPVIGRSCVRRSRRRRGER